MYDRLVYVAPTIVTHNAQFLDLQKNQVVVLHGIDAPAQTTPTIVDKLGNVNFVRIRVNWSEIEPTEGQFDTAAGGPLDELDQRVADYEDKDVNVLIDFHVTTTSPMPTWASDQTGPDWWADPKSPGLYEPFVDMMVNRYDAYPNVMGYEIWNEPQGAPATAAGTDEVIRWESKIIASIRQIDTQRAIVVMLRGGSDLGLLHAQLHHFTDTRHLVLDFHDPFCGCVTNAKGKYVSGYSADGESLIKPSPADVQWQSRRSRLRRNQGRPGAPSRVRRSLGQSAQPPGDRRRVRGPRRRCQRRAVPGSDSPT